MKTLFYFNILSFLLITCFKDKSTFNDDRIFNEIENEVKAEIDSLIKGCELLDMNRAFKAFSKSQDFLMIAEDGNFYDYKTFYENNKGYLKSCSRLELFTKKLDIKAVSNDLVIASWLYKVKATLKTGEQNNIENAGVTFLFKKINNVWVINKLSGILFTIYQK